MIVFCFHSILNTLVAKINAMIKAIWLARRNHWTQRSAGVDLRLAPFLLCEVGLFLIIICLTIGKVEELRKILAELSILNCLQLLLVQVHLAFLMQLFDGDHAVQVRLRHLVVRVGRDGPKELRISIDEFVVQLALTNCLLKQLVFRQLVQRLVCQQVLVRLPYLF